MPGNNVTDLITDQEMQFARLVLSGTMTDRQAAEAASLDPGSAAYIKSKPRVHDYMLEHRAAIEQKLIEQDAGELRRLHQSRERVLARLWEIADLESEKTRNSMSSQVKALSMIIAIEGLIPDRRAVSAQNKPAPSPVAAQFYKSAWNRTQQDGENVDPGPQSAPGSTDEPPPVSGPTPDPTPDVSESSFFGSPLETSQTTPPQTTSPVPRVPMADYFAPDTRVPFSIPKNPFARRRF